MRRGWLGCQGFGQRSPGPRWVQVLTALPSTGPVTVASIVGDLRRSDGARWVWRVSGREMRDAQREGAFKHLCDWSAPHCDTQGVGARVASLAPGTAVSWLCYEVLKGTLGVR